MSHSLYRSIGSLAILFACLFGAGRALAAVEDEIHAAEEARYIAMAAADGPALAAVLADEFLYHQLNGKTSNKALYVESFRSGSVKINSWRRYDVTVHVYGDVATTMGSTVVDLVMRGEPMVVDLRYLNVWVKRDGRWQLAARQSAVKAKP